MSRRATVNPDWLDRLLVRWGLRSLDDDGGGWPSVCPMLRDGIPTGRAGSADPFNFGSEDFEALERAIQALPEPQRLAITRAYKPWTAPSIDALMPALTDTWLKRLKAAALTLAAAMARPDERMVA